MLPSVHDCTHQVSCDVIEQEAETLCIDDGNGVVTVFKTIRNEVVMNGIANRRTHGKNDV